MFSERSQFQVVVKWSISSLIYFFVDEWISYEICCYFYYNGGPVGRGRKYGKTEKFEGG